MSKIPKIRRAHRASTTRLCNSAYENINAEVVNVAKLKQQRQSIAEKVQTLSKLDEEMLDQADIVREKLTLSIIDIDRAIELTEARPLELVAPPMATPTVTTPPIRITPPVDTPKTTPPVDTPSITTTPTSLVDTTTSTPLTMSLTTTDSSAPTTRVPTVSETVTIATPPTITVPTGVMTPVMATGVTPAYY